MIRTRDFLLYMLALVFLVSSIGYTVTRDLAMGNQKLANQVSFVAPEATAYGAVANAYENDRETYIEQMRAKIANGEGKIPGAPVVLTSVDTSVTSGDSSTPVTNRGVLWCGGQMSVTDITSTWDASMISINTVEGARLVLRGEEASSTEPVLQLPVRQIRAPHDACLSHDIVGVTLDGDLIRNSDAHRFQSTGEYTLIGYALDGFPIYGVRSNASALDTCGGLNAGPGYQYHIRADENFVLGCFAGAPAQFIR